MLGFDPAPGDPTSVERMSRTVHQVVRGLVEGRLALDSLAPAGSIWDGALGAPIVALLRRYSLQLAEIEEVLIGCLTALDGWRAELDERQARVGELVDRVADLAVDADAQERRERLLAQAREVESEHRAGARQLAVAFEEVSSFMERLAGSDQDLDSELDAALRAMMRLVQEWVEAEGPELLRTAAALGEVAALTTVISELVGIAALGRVPGEAAGVHDVISRSPAAHRLIRALHQRWAEVAPTLPEATFGRDRHGELAEAIAFRLAGDDMDRPG